MLFLLILNRKYSLSFKPQTELYTKEDTQGGQNNSCATNLFCKFGFCKISYPIRVTERLKSKKVNHDKMYFIDYDFFRLYLP